MPLNQNGGPHAEAAILNQRHFLNFEIKFRNTFISIVNCFISEKHECVILAKLRIKKGIQE
jgi:predicted nucleic acid binding AN1-type Zn finger protein